MAATTDTHSPVLAALRRHIDQHHGGNKTRFAAQHNVSESYVYMVLTGRRDVPAWMAELAGFTRELTVHYRPKRS